MCLDFNKKGQVRLPLRFSTASGDCIDDIIITRFGINKKQFFESGRMIPRQKPRAGCLLAYTHVQVVLQCTVKGDNGDTNIKVHQFPT